MHSILPLRKEDGHGEEVGRARKITNILKKVFKVKKMRKQKLFSYFLIRMKNTLKKEKNIMYRT